MLYMSPFKVVLVILVCLAGLAFSAPNVLDPKVVAQGPTWWKPLSLGLDLQGGSHLLVEVDVDSAFKEQMEAAADALRVGLREQGVRRYQDLSVGLTSIRVRVTDPEDREKAETVLRDIDPDMTLNTEDDGLLILSLTEVAINERTASTVQQSIEIIRRRVDEMGTREPTIQRQGSDRIVVQVPGIDDPQRLKGVIGRTAKMDFYLACKGAVPGSGPPPPSCREVPDASGVGTHYVERRKAVSGEHLVDSQPTFQDGRPIVSFRFDGFGARKFGDVTSENVGRPLVIILDGQVISAPVIQSPIVGGSGIITGQFTVQEVQDLSLLLRAGALPAPLTYLEERTVGPGLGADSIRAGTLASLLGLVLVVVFMMVGYGLFGLFAVVALLFNLVILFGALSGLGATLTLPGIAGIVLTMGMAVDANVLIFERMREEVRNGRTVLNAVESGFARAFTTILDSNITTLIAALLLFSLGSGPVRGFAVTLGLGILSSMFTALLLTRLQVVTYVRRTRPKLLPV